jgi:hypothetical protein
MRPVCFNCSQHIYCFKEITPKMKNKWPGDSKINNYQSNSSVGYTPILTKCIASRLYALQGTYISEVPNQNPLHPLP